MSDLGLEVQAVVSMGARGNPLKQLPVLSEVPTSSKPLFSKEQDMKNTDKLKYFEGEEAFA